MAQLPGRAIKDEDGAEVETSDDLAAIMRALGKRANVVRSYCKHVLDEGMTAAQWRKKIKGTPVTSVWTKPYSQGGKYWGSNADHDPLFRKAITEYWGAMQKTRTAQHLRLSALAEKKMQEAVPVAANSMIKLAGKARNEQTKYNAARFLISQRARSIDVEDATMWDEAEDGAQDGTEVE